jgi:hypothetical protein
MNPKIDKIVMSNSGHQATVSGPIEWESDDTSATFSAAVVQMAPSGHTVFAAGQNARVFTPPNDQRWEADVRTLNGNQLVAGAADGWAAAAVLETSSYECYPWKTNGIQVIEDHEVVTVQ